MEWLRGGDGRRARGAADREPGGQFVWRPIRRQFGISAFGTNAYTADAGQRVVEEHSEKDGHEEMYVVLRGRATFTLGDDEVDAPAGTIVYARPGTKRGAVAAEDDTAILAVGAKPGVVFEPSPWEDIFAAFSYAQKGEVEKGRELITGAVARRPDEWQGHFNASCYEILYGDKEAGIAHAPARVRARARAGRRGREEGQRLRRGPRRPAGLSDHRVAEHRRRARAARAPGRARDGRRAARAPCSSPASAPTSTSSPTASANAL